MNCSETAADAVLLATNVRALVLALQKEVFSTCLLVRLLEEFDVLRVVGVLDHLGEGQSWITTVLLTRNANVCCAVLPVVVAAIKDLGAAFDPALVLLDAEMYTLVSLEVFGPLEPALTSIPVAVFPLDSGAVDWFTLACNRVHLVALDIDVAVV